MHDYIPNTSILVTASTPKAPLSILSILSFSLFSSLCSITTAIRNYPSVVCSGLYDWPVIARPQKKLSGILVCLRLNFFLVHPPFLPLSSYPFFF